MNKVYFVEAVGLGLVKIGTTTDLKLRLRTLQLYTPTEVILLATLRGGWKREQEIHHQFSASRQRGEWFRLTQDLADFIGHIQDNPEPPEQTVSFNDLGLTWRVTPTQFFSWMEYLFGPEWTDCGPPAIGFSRPELRRWWEDAENGVCSIPALALRNLMDAHRNKIVRLKRAGMRIDVVMSPIMDTPA